MESAIWKYTFHLGEQTIDIPEPCQFVSMAVQHGDATAWFRVHLEGRVLSRNFAVVATGESFDYPGFSPLGSFMMGEGFLVFHLLLETENS